MYEDFFFKRLAQLRIQKGVSAREMSLAIGQNDSYINRIESKRAYPSMQGFFYICEYLQVSPKEFFDDGAENPAYLNDALDGLRRLDRKQLDIVLSVIDGLLE